MSDRGWTFRNWVNLPGYPMMTKAMAFALVPHLKVEVPSTRHLDTAFLFRPAKICEGTHPLQKKNDLLTLAALA